MTRTLRSWKARIVGGFIALSGLGFVGCKHPLFQDPADSPLLRRPNIPAALEERPHDPILPGSAQVNMEPATVLDLKRQTRPLALKEALAIAFEQGNIGGGGAQGQDSTALPNFTGRGASVTDTIKAFVLDPAIAAVEVERSLSKFDARWITSMSWTKQDQATLNLQQSFSNGDQAAFSSTLAKPLPTGGVAGITTSINYQNLSNPPPANSGFVTLNSSYTPRVQFVFEQPLLQGFGVEANQLLSNHPGSLLIQGFRTTGAGTEGILVSRLRAEQTRSQFDANLNLQLVNVEVAYWNLYAAYYNLYAQEEGYKESFRALKFNRDRDKVGLEEPQLLPQLEVQVWQFYTQVIQARGQVLESDRVLRGLLGLKSDDGTVFVPSDEPIRTPYVVDIKQAYEEGLRSRPEVLIARQELKARQLDMRAQKIGRMPDFRLFTSYDVNGLGARFFGQPNNAFSNLASNQFNSWQVGLRLDIPLGYRDANALVRQSQLNLWRTWYSLSDAERKVLELLIQAKRQMDQAYAEMEANKNRRDATERQFALINDRINGGQFTGSSTYLQLTQAQERLASSTAAEFRAVADYNSALARVEYAKGTIQRYNNIGVLEGALPAFVQTRATDHYRARQAALKLREHPADVRTGNLSGFQFAPMTPMTPQTVTALPPALPAPQPGPGLTPDKTREEDKEKDTEKDKEKEKDKAAEKDTVKRNPSKPAPGTFQPYDKWQGNGTPTSTPATLPALPSPVVKPTAEAAPGNIVPNGSLTLPKRVPATPDANQQPRR